MVSWDLAIFPQCPQGGSQDFSKWRLPGGKQDRDKPVKIMRRNIFSVRTDRQLHRFPRDVVQYFLEIFKSQQDEVPNNLV